MEENVPASLSERTVTFLKKNVLFVSLVFIGVLLVLTGLFQYFSSHAKSSDMQFVQAAQDVEGAKDSNIKISVDVEGQVQNPGVYKVDDGARLQDALIAAGGMSSMADREYVAQHLNLAQKVIDGGKIYIPAVNEKPTADTSVNNNPSSNNNSQSILGDNSGLININSATAEQLDTLPKVGPVTAQKIIGGRPYATIEELVSKKILGQKTYDELKDKIMAE
jgi:competence protein ComEA